MTEGVFLTIVGIGVFCIAFFLVWWFNKVNTGLETLEDNDKNTIRTLLILIIV